MQTRSMFARFPALTWIGGIFCFLVLPFLLVNEGLESLLQLRHEREVDQVLQQMDSRLDYLKKQVDDAAFFQKILSLHYKRALSADNPIEAFSASKKWLQKTFPARFKFIVWDAMGKPVDKLTDEKNYQYIVVNLFSFFKAVAENCRNNPPGSPERLSIVERRLNLFRSYLGRFLVPSHLRLPFLAGELSRCVLADHHERFPLFWFDVNDRLSAFCSIQPLEPYSGVKFSVEQLNGSGEIVKTGIIDMHNLDLEQSGLSEEEFRQLLMELGKFENASLPHRRTEDILWSFKLLSHDLRGFCMLRKKDIPTGYPDKVKWQTLAKAFGLLAILSFCVFVAALGQKRLLVSITWRTAFLFIYANGLPLLILATIGAEYVQQKELALIQQVHNDQEKVLLEIDSGYKRHRLSMQRKMKDLLADYTREMQYRSPSAEDHETLKSIAEKNGADEVAIFSSGGETTFNYRRSRQALSKTFIKIFARTALAYANQRTADDAAVVESELKKGNMGIPRIKSAITIDSASIIKDLLETLERVEDYTFGTDAKLCFVRLFGNKSKTEFHSAIIFFWIKEEVQQAFAQNLTRHLSKASSKGIYATFAMHNAQISSGKTLDPELLRPYLQKAYNLQSARENNLQIDGERFILTALAGRQLGNLSLASVIRADMIEEQVRQMQIRMILFSLISFLIVSGVILTLTSQFLLPVRQLQEAVRNIGRRDFTYRTRIFSNDEFGDLGAVFNTTIEEMGDLAIGKVVQEALFPGNDYGQNNIAIYAKTVTMTKLGGDYYDFFSLSENQTGIFMGDVAGHGIPAALVMAMAKSTVISCPELLSDPSVLLSGMHQMLFRLKTTGFKRMMTCQYLVVNDLTGVCSFANAGHCYPVIVSANGASARYLEIIGSPVGIGKRARYANHEIHLEPGDTVILYSDCMIEAMNADNKMFGADRLLEAAKTCWSNDLEVYYRQLFEVNARWSASIEDDTTVVLVNYCAGGARNA